MDFTTAATHYAEATRLYQQGNLHRSRDEAEQALLSLTSSFSANTASATSLSNNITSCNTQHASQRFRQHHQLFGNTLLLLSSVYIAVREYTEAERLLATCEGYWKEHLYGADAHNNTATNEIMQVEGAGVPVDCRDLDEGLAAVAYNRAVLRLEQLDQNTSASAPLGSCATLPDVLRTSAPPLSSPTSSSSLVVQEEERRRAAASEILTTYLYDARDKLSHTLGSQRCLLADVYHSCGVCFYYLKDYVSALEAWQQSMAIRVHVHSCRAKSKHNEQARHIEADEDTFVLHSGVEELKIALTLEHIAQVYQHIEGKTVDALKMYDTVVVTRERFLGPLHPLYARTLLEKAVLASRLGHGKLARALLDTCHGICQRNYGECGSQFTEEVQRWRDYVISTT